jgi:uncharacterized membrane protein (DUF485 family)
MTVIQKIFNYITKVSFFGFLFFLLILLGLSWNINTFAQNTTPTNRNTNTVNTTTDTSTSNIVASVGFSECNLAPQPANYDPNSASEQFQKCINQILRFAFVIALFLVSIRIGAEALISINPLINGKAIDNSVKLVSDVVIGLVLIGSPGIFLSFFNQTTLAVQNIINLRDLTPAQDAGQTQNNNRTNTNNQNNTGNNQTNNNTNNQNNNQITINNAEEYIRKLANGDSNVNIDQLIALKTSGNNSAQVKQLIDEIYREQYTNNPNENFFFSERLVVDRRNGEIILSCIPDSKVNKLLEYCKPQRFLANVNNPDDCNLSKLTRVKFNDISKDCDIDYTPMDNI